MGGYPRLRDERNKRAAGIAEGASIGTHPDALLRVWTRSRASRRVY